MRTSTVVIIILTLALCLICLLPGFISANLIQPIVKPAIKRSSTDNVITLTAEMVKNAADIETALHTITSHGTERGTVELDGSKGPFVYSEGIDHSINIIYSDVTIRGVNNAMFMNASEGFSFEKGHSVNTVVIQNLSMICDKQCVSAEGEYTNVKLIGNTFQSVQSAIDIRSVKQWTIQNNQINAGGSGIFIHYSSEITADKNQITAPIAIQLEGSMSCKINNNNIGPSREGILLTAKADKNTMLGNQMGSIEVAGFHLVSGILGNRLESTKVYCRPDYNCLKEWIQEK